jgi:hypothetical protein
MSKLRAHGLPRNLATFACLDFDLLQIQKVRCKANKHAYTSQEITAHNSVLNRTTIISTLKTPVSEKLFFFVFCHILITTYLTHFCVSLHVEWIREKNNWKKRSWISAQHISARTKIKTQNKLQEFRRKPTPPVTEQTNETQRLSTVRAQDTSDNLIFTAVCTKTHQSVPTQMNLMFKVHWKSAFSLRLRLLHNLFPSGFLTTILNAFSIHYMSRPS